MNKTNNEDIQKLKKQIEKTIPLLEEKIEKSGEQAVEDYLERYRYALDLLIDKNYIFNIEDFRKKLLDWARGYLESSSHWDQQFLNEMYQTEKIIRKISDEE